MTEPQPSQADVNFAAFRNLLPELLRTHPGKFAVLNNGSVAEFFDTMGEAVRFGYAKFGDHNFSVQLVASTIGRL